MNDLESTLRLGPGLGRIARAFLTSFGLNSQEQFRGGVSEFQLVQILTCKPLSIKYLLGVCGSLGSLNRQINKQKKAHHMPLTTNIQLREQEGGSTLLSVMAPVDG